MMGHQPANQPKLFYNRINLENRIRKDHPLRIIDQKVDFNFIYKEVKDCYGQNGNVSVPPPVILKMMFLLFFYNVRSERELMDTIPERLDWLWFLGYDLDDQIPNHSVLSKARNRWGTDVFKTFFENIVWQCAQAGLIDGSKLFMDSSLIQADASNNSVIDQTSLKRYLNKSYRLLEDRLEEQPSEVSDKKGATNRKYISTTDPDASVIRMGGRSKLRYKTHRAVDQKAEVITATKVTTGEVNEAHCMTELVDQHEQNTGESTSKVVADSKYGTIDNYLACHDRDILPHFETVDKNRYGKGKRKGIFEPKDFEYIPEKDFFICPAGEELKKRMFHKKRNHFEYAISGKICNKCKLKPQCTRSKTGRTVKRHIRQNDLDIALSQSLSHDSKKDIKTRQSLMERSFARSTRYGFKRSRWRRLWRLEIQEYLTSAIQNIMVLIKSVKERKPSGAIGATGGSHRNSIGGPYHRNKAFWPHLCGSY